MKFNKVARRIGTASIVAVLALMGTSANAANLPGAVSMFKADADIVFAANLEAKDQKTSLMNYIPVAELGEQGLQTAKQQQNTPQTVMLTLITKSEVLKLHTFAMGMSLDLANGGANEINTGVFLGDFTSSDAFSKLKTLGVQPGPDNTTGKMMTSTGETVYLRIPGDGVILMSDDMGWLDSAKTLSQQKAGLLNATSPFNATVATMGGRTPDVIVWARGSALSQAIGSNPAVMMQVGPLASTLKDSVGAALALFPGQQPTVELHTATNSADAASMGVQQWQQMSQMVKQMLQFAPVNTPEEKEGIEMFRKGLDEVQSVAQGNNLVIRYTVNELPADAAASRQGFLEGMQKAMQSGMIP